MAHLLYLILVLLQHFMTVQCEFNPSLVPGVMHPDYLNLGPGSSLVAYEYGNLCTLALSIREDILTFSSQQQSVCIYRRTI